jgi:cation/acetate symporter
MAFQSHSRPANPYVGTSFATYAAVIAGLVIILVIFEQLGINSVWLGHVVIVVPVLSYVVIGFLTRTVLADEFFVSGRRVPAFYNGLGFAAASFGGIGFFALTGALFLIGFDALAIGLGLVAGLVLMAQLFVPYLRKYGAYTLPSFLGERFDSAWLRVTAGLLLLPPSMLLLSAELRIAAEILSQFVSVNFQLLILACATIVVLTNVLGGVRSLTWTSSAQMLVVFLGLLTPLVILSVMHTTLPLPQLTYGSLFNDILRVEQGSGLAEATPVALMAALPGENTLTITKPMLQLFGSVGRFDFLFLMLSVALGTAVLPAGLLRIGNSFSVTQARRSIGWGVVLMSILLMTVPAVAVFARYLLLDPIINQPLNAMPHWFKELQDAGMVQTQDLNNDGLLQLREFAVLRNGVALILPIVGELPFVLVGFAAAAGMAAALAAAGSQLVAMATSISEDLVQGLASYRLSGARRLLYARLSMIANVIIAGFIAVNVDFDLLHMGLWALSLAAGSFFAPLVLSIWWREISREAVFAGMLAGAAATLLVVLLGWLGIADSFLGISNLTAAVLGVPVGFAAAAAVAYRQRAVSPVVSEVLDEIRIPDGETVYDYKERLVSGRGF